MSLLSRFISVGGQRARERDEDNAIDKAKRAYGKRHVVKDVNSVGEPSGNSECIVCESAAFVGFDGVFVDDSVKFKVSILTDRNGLEGAAQEAREDRDNGGRQKIQDGESD